MDDPEEVAKFYEENPGLGIDLDAPDAEENWKAVRTALQKRHTDYLDMFMGAAGEIAKIPVGLAEGVIENGMSLKGIGKTLYSVPEGAARGLRDMWGIAAQSENPDSIFFNLRSLIGAVMHGKLSKDWREEAQQWNEARKFLYHSHLMSQGDETLLEQFSSLNLSEEAKQNLRGMVNPKIAHAMAFMGLELPSLLTAPFTGGASAAGAISASVNMAARAQANASRFRQIGMTMAKVSKDFEHMAGRFSETIIGNTAYGLGRALQPLATASEAVLGGTVESIAKRSGYVAREVEQAATVTAMNAVEATGTRQTVGFIGSLGLRTSSELLQEFGDTVLQRANGVITASEINGLTVLERLAESKNLSPSARFAAKAANVIVDPFVQMSTAGLKNAYKDAFIFGGLGYMNDQMRGAVGGAATGMVWGGYSGAFRHTWSNINGGFHASQVIDTFDRNFIPQIEVEAPQFANVVRKAVSDVDAFKSQKASASTRFALQTAFLALSPEARGNFVSELGTLEGLKAKLQQIPGMESHVAQIEKINPESKKAAKGFFMVATDAAGIERPILFLNKDNYRPVDVGHEILSHLAIYSLMVRGKGGDYVRQLIGSEKDGGAFGDDKMLLDEAVRRRVVEELVGDQNSIKAEAELAGMSAIELSNKIGKERYAEIYSQAESLLSEVRTTAKSIGPEYWLNRRWLTEHGNTNNAVFSRPRDPSRPNSVEGITNGEFIQRYIFEETIAKYSESLFMHTNLFDIPFEGKTKPIRLVMERLRNEIFAKQVTQLELAGIRARIGEFFTKDGTSTVQAEVYDGGKYYRHEAVEGIVRNLINEARSGESGHIETLSPERQAIEARRYGKEYLFNFSGKGATFLGTKEQNELFTKNAQKAFSVLEALPQDVRPEVVLDQFGNKSIDMYQMKDEAFDALRAAGVLDAHAIDTAKGMRDMMARYESSGFTESNLMAGFYWGDKHRIQKDGFFQRLLGKDAPVTYRVFVPFELKMTLKTTDSNGKPLRTPRGGAIATVVDYMAIHRRKIRMWQRSDVHSLFVTSERYNDLFDKYLINMMADPATRVPSAELFRAEFGAKAETVRDIMYETFGGRKRNDESYINAPREGYSSNPENPDYPIHSMKLELIVGTERLAAKPLAYHHGRSYEGLRRNYSVGGFTIYGQNQNRLRNAQGYEISEANRKFKLFNPFGVMVGIYDSAKKAIKAANKDLTKLDEADIMPTPIDVADAKIPTSGDVRAVTSDYSSEKALMFDGGMRLQHGGMNYKTGRMEYFREDFVPDLAQKIMSIMPGLATSKDAQGKNIRPYLPTAGLTYADLVSDKGAGLDAFFERTGTLIRSTDIIVMPAAPVFNAASPTTPIAGRFLSKAKHGEYGVLEPNVEAGRPVITIDVDAINADHGISAQNKIDSILRHKMAEAISTYGPDAIIQGAMTGTPARAYVGIGTLQNSRILATHLRNLMKKDKQVLSAEIQQAISDAKARVASSTAPFDTHFIINADGTASPVAGGAFDPAKTTNVHFVRDALQSIGVTGVAAIGFLSQESPRIVKSINQKALELISLAYAYNKGLHDYGEYINFPSLTGGIGVAIVHTGKNYHKFDAIVKRFDAALAQLSADFDTSLLKESKYYENLWKMANSLAHSLLQKGDNNMVKEHSAIHGGTIPFGDRAKGGVAEYLILPSVVLKNLTFGKENISRIEPSVQTTYQQAQINLFEGSAYVIDVTPTPSGKFGKNVLGGFTGSGGDMRFNMGSRMKNRSAPVYEGGPLVGSMDQVIAQDALGNLPSDSFMNSAGYMNYLLVQALHEMPEHANVIEKLHQDYLKNADEVSFIDSIDRLASSSNKSLVMETADEVRAVAVTWSKNNQPSTNGWHSNAASFDYVQNWAKTKVLESMSKHFGLDDGKVAVGERAISSSRAYKVLKASGNDSDVSIALLRSTMNKVAKLSKFTNQEIKRIRQSVGDLSVVDDFAKRDELKARGLVSEITFNGKTINVFEFSDAGASLNLAKAANRPHILPFLSTPDPEGAFSDYAAAVRRRLTLPPEQRYISDNIILGEAKLGDIFEHAELYQYYPEFRDIRVHFKDFHGGRHINAGGTSIIELGLRSFTASELNLPAEQMGSIFNNKEALRSQWIKDNPLSSIILHEVQHAIQLKHGWIGNDIQLKDIPSKVAAHAFGNLLGIKTSLALKSDLTKAMKEPDFMVKQGKFVELKEADKAANSESELLMRMVEASKSPVIRSLKANAKPLMVSAARNFAEFILSEHELGNVSDAMAKKAMELHFDAKFAGDLTAVIDVYQRLADFRRESILTMPNYSIRMHDNMQFRTAFNALGLVSTFDILDAAMPTEAAALLMESISNYKDMSYVMAPVEKMARETEQRRGKTEAELAAEPRVATDDNVKDPVLKIIRNAMDMSKLGSDRDMVKNISQHGIAPVILQSVGGLGETDVTDSRVLTIMGKAVLMHGIADMANETLDILNRVAVRTNGWQVDKNGRMTLTTGTHILKGVTGEQFARNLKQVFGEENVPSTSGGNEVTIPGNVMASEGHTYTIEDLAVLGGAVVESSSVFTVGNSAIDAVMAPHFPAYFRGSDIMDLMRKSGIATEDAMAVAKVAKIAEAFSDVTLTKNDLINLMAVNHSQFVMPTQMESSKGSPIVRAGEVLANAVSTASGEKRRSLVLSEEGRPFMMSATGSAGYATHSSSFAVGYFGVNGQRIVFETGDTPKWVLDLGQEAVEKWAQISTNIGNRLKERDRNTFVGDAELRNKTVERLNREFHAKASLIEPIVNEAIKSISESANIGRLDKLKMAFMLMDDIERANMVMVSHEIMAKHPANISLIGDGTAYNFMTPHGHLGYGLSNLPKRAGGKEGALLAIGGTGAEEPLTGHMPSRSEINAPLLQLSLFNPSAVSLADAVAHATSTIHVGVSPITTIEAGSRPTMFSGLRGYEPSMAKTVLSTLSPRNVDYSIKEQIVEQAVMKREQRLREIGYEKDSLRSIMKGDRDGVLDEHATLTVEQAETLYESILNEQMSLGRDQLIMDRIANSELFTEYYNADRNLSIGSRGMQVDVVGRREGFPVAGQGTIAISNAQGRVIGDSLVVDVEQVSPSLAADSYFASSGMTMRLVPLEIRRRYVKGKTYQDLSLAISLFGSIADTGDAEKPQSRATDRLAIVGEVALELAGDDKFGGQSSYTVVRDSGLAHVVGGNAVLVVGNLMEAGLASGDMKNYVSANSGRIQEIFGNQNNLFSKPSTSLGQKISANEQGGTIRVNNRTVGLAAAFPLAVMLKHGFMDFWEKDNELSMNVPAAFRGVEYKFLTSDDGLVEFKTGVLVPETDAMLDAFMAKLDTHAIDTMVGELSTNQNARTVADLMAYMNLHEVLSKDISEPVAKLGDKQLKHSVDFALATSAHYNAKIHAALADDIAGFSPAMTKDYVRVISEAIKTKDFWIGFFSQPRAANQMETYIPRANDSSLFFSRHSKSEERVPVFYGTAGGNNLYRTSVKNGHSVDNISYVETSASGLHTFGENKIGIDDPSWTTAYGENSYNKVIGVGGPVISAMSRPMGFAIPQEIKIGQFEEFNANSLMLFGRDEKTTTGGRAVFSDNMPVTKAVQEVGGKIKALPNPSYLSNGTRRTLMVNQIADMAKKLGVEKVSIQPARYTATSRPDALLYSLRTSADVANVAGRSGFGMSTAFTTGFNFGVRRSVENRPSTGFSWNRLEDGRILVNFSPDTNVIAGGDRAYAAVSRKHDIGINLSRVLGYNHDFGGIITPQDPRYQATMAGMGFSYGTGKALRDSQRIIGYAANHMLGHLPFFDANGAIDQALIRHYRRSIAADLRKAVVGPVYAERLLTDQINSGLRGAGLVAREMETAYRNANTEISPVLGPSGNIEGITNFMSGNGGIISGLKNDYGYVSFVLPKDATIEQFQRAIMAYYMMATERSNADMFSEAGVFNAKSKFLTQNYTWSRSGTYVDMMMAKLKQTAIEDTGRDMSVRDFSAIQKTSDGSGGGNLVGNKYASLLAKIHERDPLFISGVEQAFQMMTSSDKGYHMPLAEQNLRKSGDRLAIIRAMFPGRPELEQFAWDNADSMNLSVVAPSRGSGSKNWLVGYDKVVGYDSAGMPIKERVVRSHRSETDARQFANSVAKSGILAEHVKMLSLETDATIQKLPSDPNVGAEIYQPLRLNEAAIEGPAPILTADSTYAVGNFAKTFATEAEAKAFQKMVLESEAITGKAPQPGTVRLSTGDLLAMERDLKERIGFSTMGSPLQFASTAMNAIVRGGDKNRQFKDKATGLQWYEMLTFNGVGKQEMRVVGLAQFLYDHRTVTLSRQEVAEYIYAMYPVTGRRSIAERGTAGSAEGRIPDTKNPLGAARAMAHQYKLMHSDMFYKLKNLEEAAVDSDKPQLAAFVDALKARHLDAFKKALSEFYSADKVDEMFPSYSHVYNAFSLDREMLKISGPLMEIYREGYNDMVRSMPQEQLNLAAGVELLLPDPRGHYDQQNVRPGYLRPLEAPASTESLEINGNKVFTNETGTRDWAEYSSAASNPYQVDVLFGRVAVDAKEYEKYNNAINGRIQAATDPAEVQRLESILASAQRTFEFRKYAAQKSRQNGHWNTGDGTMQYTHLRYSGVIALAESLPNPDPLELVDSVNQTSYAGEHGAGQFVTLIEELQSDPYQRATFGPPKEAEQMSASDFKQAEAFGLIPELKAINKELSVFEVSTDSKMVPVKWNYDWPRTNNTKVIHHAIIAPLFFSRLSLPEKHMVLRLAIDDGKDLNPSYDIRPESAVMLSKEEASRFGLPQEIRPFELSKVDEAAVHEYITGHLLSEQYTADDGSMHAAKLSRTLFPEKTGVVPNLDGKFEYVNYFQSYNRTQRGLGGQIYALLGFMALGDESLHASAERLATVMERGTKHGIDFDAMAYSFLNEFNRRLSENTTLSPSSKEYAKLMAMSMEEMLKQGEINPEHLTRDQKQSRWAKYEMGEHDYASWSQKKFVYYVDALNSPGGSEQYSRYIAMTPVEAVMYDLDRQSKHIAEDPSKLANVREAHETSIRRGEDPLMNPGIFLRNIYMFQPESITPELIQKAIQDGYDFSTLNRVDGDMDPAGTGVSGSYLLAFPHEAKTPLGRMLEINAFYAMSSVYQFGGDIKVNELKQKRSELMAKMKLPEPKDYNFPDTIPLGEDNAYRELAVKYYAMRALQAGQNGLVIADARHHRTRYSSLEHMTAMVTLGKGHVYAIGKQNLVIPYVLSKAVEKKAHGDFFGRLVSGEMSSGLRPNGQIEHNGLVANVGDHIAAMAREVLPELPQISSELTAESFGRSVAGTRVNTPNGQYELHRVLDEILSGNRQPVSSENLLSLSQQYHGSEQGLDVFKRVAKYVDNPQYLMSNVPVDKTHGYAVNYGAPHWNNLVYYAGLPADFIAKQSHDLFARPVVEMKDGKFNILDPKTGKLLIGGIESQGELRERMAQLSKYLGSVPIVSVFLKQFARVGGYAMEGHLFEGSSAGTMASTKMNEAAYNRFKEKYPDIPLEEARLKMNRARASTEASAADPFGMNAVVGGENEPATAGKIKSFNQIRKAAEGWQSAPNYSNGTNAVMLHAMGVTSASDSLQMAHAVNRMVGFNGPMLIIKPRYQTEAFRKEMLKMVRSGIPLMSVGDLQNPAARVKEAIRVYKFYEDVKPLSTSRTQDEER